MSWLSELIKKLPEEGNKTIDLDEFAEILGLNPKEVNDPSIKCAVVLGQGLQPNVCSDFRAIRRWVMCRTWELLDSGGAKSFREAVRKAWEEARLGCGGGV